MTVIRGSALSALEGAAEWETEIWELTAALDAFVLSPAH